MKRLKVLISLLFMVLMCGCEITVEKRLSDESEDSRDFSICIDEERLYEILVAELPKGKSIFDFDCVVEMDVLDKVVARIEHNYPEYYWVSDVRTISTSGNCSTVNFNPVGVLDEEQAKAELIEIQNAADRIISLIPENFDDYEKILFVHDYLADNVVYATEKVGIETEGSWDTVYGSLVQGYAVCGGYSKGFSYIMKLLGIESGVVCGEVANENGEQIGHAWNYVKLNDMYYWVDVTWDDTDDENNPVIHFYFLIDDILMNRNRVLRKDQFFVPVCYSMSDNFCVRNNSYIAYYSADAVGNAMLSSPYDNKVEMMFSDKVSYDAALMDLFENGKLWELSDYAYVDETVTYSVNDDLYAICINY